MMNQGQQITTLFLDDLSAMLAGVLDEESLKLYTLIWSRTVSCQMEPANLEKIQVEFGNVDRSIMLRSSSSRVEFPGYQEVFTVWLVLADKLYCEEVLFILVMVRYHLSIQLIALYK
ncbi:putative DNA topoisomerase, type IA [Medicago truncatula]|uniref:Putative DNA topoisomerase, type IA n=1 Tax=Medicago truncatula TaxID=3880 RepID=A0A396JP32_MEDTR|nr:putative DNA topoisomerase, type IA [Medicago truncatula]